MGWELEELEEAALLVLAEHKEGVDGSTNPDGTEDTMYALSSQLEHVQLSDTPTRPLIEELSYTNSTTSGELEDESSSGTETETSSETDSKSGLKSGSVPEASLQVTPSKS